MKHAKYIFKDTKIHQKYVRIRSHPSQMKLDIYAVP